VACEVGHPDLAARIKAYYPPPDTSILVLLYDQRVADASEALAEGDAMGAISLLRGAQVIATGGAPLQYQALRVFAAAFDELTEVDSAIAYLERAANLGYMSHTAAAAVRHPKLKRRLAELEEVRGNPQAALRHYEQLLELWSAKCELTLPQKG
jgi:tetratricopeptide (TPR) repeat protein